MFRYRRSYAKGNHCSGPINHQDQNHRSSRAKVLRLDRWLYPLIVVDFPDDVDYQEGVRRVWPQHCAPKVLLVTFIIFRHKFSQTNKTIHTRGHTYPIKNQTLVAGRFICFIVAGKSTDISTGVSLGRAHALKITTIIY